ncbi:D-3-phosphoglycerate dehydrogenase [Croceitalea dokdonensis DOKDO 023]|uniref:D-3-phosphoglycerate dehydrogenase n=1 Tax=Croceitalea dokdonensis DOKDO 023 TaxID=1300341 RepID=A0A0N8H4G4_9FLAO|nr:D-2-hydroxyacid dehydrogenase [Croceitalea dokdonensis]KPM33300.1 D-3-phosphoglycerate dehydrogenase [Croceitalea dokdonensis DOKDO 023]
MKILANDGISAKGKTILQEAGFDVVTVKVANEQLDTYINENEIDILLVRGATQVDKKIIDSCPGLQLIGRAGVGMDNIAADHATLKGIKVINTPAASSASVAELVFAHLFSGARFLHDANRNMPLEGDSRFNQLKKAYASGMELRGKTLGIIGFGRIGQAVANIAIGIGMKVIFTDHRITSKQLTLEIFDGQRIMVTLTASSFSEVLESSDFITLHVPAQKGYLIGKKEFAEMKDGVGIINAARGGILDEVALIDAMESGKVAFAGLDVYESEPKPEIRILMHPNISLTPHIGAATKEAQDRIGLELAHQIISLLK